MFPQKKRCLHGLILGGVIALAYGLVSQLINYIVLPGIRYYQPPLGPIGNIPLIIAIGLVVGYASAYPESSVYGWFLGGGVATLIFIGASFFTGSMEQSRLWQKFVGLFFLIIPIVGLFAPLVAVHRWAVNEQGQYPHSPFYAWGRIRLPLLVVLIAAGLGMFSLHPADQRKELMRMDALVKQGLAARDSAGLPAPLQPKNVDSFIGNANAYYTLEWNRDSRNLYAIPRPAASPSSQQATLVARFKGGYVLACLYPYVQAEPTCRDYTASELHALLYSKVKFYVTPPGTGHESGVP